MMIAERPFQPHSVAGFTSTSPSYTHLRSISFDPQYLPPPPAPQDSEHHQCQAATMNVHDLYPIVSAWSLDDQPQEEDHYRHSQQDDEDDLVSPSSISPARSSLLTRARTNSKALKRKLSCLSPRKNCSREPQTLDEDEDMGVYSPQSGSWSSGSDSHRSYSHWEAIRLRVSIYLYWKRQALARKLSFRSSGS